MKTRLSKKLLSFFLAALMVFSVMGSTFSAFAIQTPDGYNYYTDQPQYLDYFIYDYPAYQEWGPYIETDITDASEQAAFAPDHVMQKGDMIAVAFSYKNQFDSLVYVNYSAKYDPSKILPAIRTKKSITCPAVDEAALLMLADDMVYSDIPDDKWEDNTSHVDGSPGAYYDYECIVGSGYLEPHEINDYTTLIDAYDVANDDYVEAQIEGTVLAVVGWQVQEEMTVAEFVNCFSDPSDELEDEWFKANNQVVCTVSMQDYYPLTLRAPQTDEPSTEVTYEFADGHQDKKTDGTQPANTVVEEPINNQNGTHTTGYKWVENGENAFKEEAITESCSSYYQHTPEVKGSCTQKSRTAADVCSKCGYATGGVEGDYDYSNHNYGAPVVTQGTCMTAGKTVYTCQDCGPGTQGHSYEVPGEKDENNHEQKVTVPQQDATCTSLGKTSYEKCNACGKNITEPQDIQMKPHTEQLNPDLSIEATCKVEGKNVYKCTVCGNPNVREEELGLNPTNHKNVVTIPKKDATRSEAGYEAYQYCNDCQKATEDITTIPAIGVAITVTGASLGSTTLNGDAIADSKPYETKNVPYGESYTLVATPEDDNVKFVGWEMDGKIITTNTTYTTTAYADTTYSPVFEEATEGTFHVTFVDMYGNVVAIYSSEQIKSDEFNKLPEPNKYAGMKFVDWSATYEYIKNELNESLVVYGTYEVDDTKSFTVTANGCNITVNSEGAVQDSATAKYNDTITVTPVSDTAAVWKVNGKAVSYGTSYTFLCGSDITVTYETSAEAAAPTVASVSETRDGETASVKFLATRSVPDGYTLVESGFVYGKDMNEEDLVLDNVGMTAGNQSAKVKQLANSNKAANGQFALTYGVSDMSSPACARPYLIYKDSGEQSHVIYGDMLTENYGK